MVVLSLESNQLFHDDYNRQTVGISHSPTINTIITDYEWTLHSRGEYSPQREQDECDQSIQFASFEPIPVRNHFGIVHRMVTSRRNTGGRRSRWCGINSLLIFVAILMANSATTAAPIESSTTESTLDVLRDQPGTSPKDIDERARRCGNITQLSCTPQELEMTSVCGSDGRTYSSVCEVKKMVCHGIPVQVKGKGGPCPAKGKCLLERAFQIDLSKGRNQTEMVIPECEPDGSYSPVQCHKQTGYCWCVTNTGRAIPNTSVQFKRPDCMPQGCSTADRSTFSSNLLRIFRDEYEKDTRQERQPTGDGATTVSVVASQTRRVIEWKFDRLDTNQDRGISLRESASLRRMIRDRVHPKACARRFAKYCDLDGDKRISKTEWSMCLGVDINMSFRLFQSLNTSEDAQRQDHEGQPSQGTDGHSAKEADDSEQRSRDLNVKSDPTESPVRNKQRNGGGRGGTRNTGRSQWRHNLYQPTQRRHASGASRLHSEDALVEVSRKMASSSRMAGLAFLTEQSEKTDKEETEEPTDCQSARRRAQEQHQMNPNSGFYIPVCQNDPDSSGAVGRLFERVQCHHVAGFCWCADPETGKPIPGTPQRFERPDCSDTRQSSKVTIQKDVEIKGCLAKKRGDFIRRLQATLVSSMLASDPSYNDDDDMPRVERALRWKFDGLDSNKNKILERKEWKPYRQELKTWKGMKKCGRNFLRSCDANADKRITLTEWLNCAGEHFKAPSSTPSSINRRGKNPFTNILDPNQ